VAAALKVAKEADDDAVIVVFNPDSGRGYLSTVFNEHWMMNFGFLKECDQCVGAVLDTRNASIENLLYVNPSAPVSEAIEIMRSNGVSQLPVCKNTPPFANAEVAGSVDELELMDVIHRNPGAMGTSVEKVMGTKLPTIGVGQKVELAVEMLETAPALLVLSGGQPLSVLTRTDLLSYFTAIAEDANNRD
jgi:cystathionine beta-synthase